MLYGSRMMAILDTLTPRRFSITLRVKFVVCISIILILACLLLSWLLVQQQVRSAAENTVQSGTLLAQHLAQMGRSSIVFGDIPRLNQHIQEILAVNPVAYVAVITPHGDLQAGFGKGEWEDQFVSQGNAPRRFTATKLVQPRHRAALTSEPLVSAIDLSDTGPVPRQTIDLTPQELLALAGGAELPIFYDMWNCITADFGLRLSQDMAAVFRSYSPAPNQLVRSLRNVTQSPTLSTTQSDRKRRQA